MPPNRILVLHNRYRESGGEDHAFAQEAAMLRERGHTVEEYVEDNGRLDEHRPVAAAAAAIWSQTTVKRLQEVLAESKPEIAHFHNTYFMISPAAYYACQSANVPVVQTLHNFRLGCANACCTLHGQPCEVCVPKRIPWQGIWRGCYRTRTASAAVVAIGAVHKTLGTYRRQVDAYISNSAYAREIHVRSGVPADRCFIKPNTCEPLPYAAASGDESFALFAGRLVSEKGIFLLIEAWRKLRLPIPLRIAGTGPAAEEAHFRARDLDSIEFLGQLPREAVGHLMQEAAFLIQPSLLYENCSLAVVEALAAGLPAVVSGRGSFLEMVEQGRTGLHFRPGDADDLAAKIAWMVEHPSARAEMGRAARRCYEQHYSPERNYEQLIGIYDAAQRHHAAKRAACGRASWRTRAATSSACE